MNQNEWGPPTWMFLHTISLNYPLEPSVEQRDRMLEFLLSLQHVLPCRYCRANYKRHLKELPAKLENRSSFFKFMVDLHNFVNSETGKKTISYREALEKFEAIYHKKIPLTLSDEAAIEQGSST